MSTSTRAIAPKTHQLDGDRLPKALLDEVSALLVGGGVAIFPTETVYGVGTSAFAPHGIRRIYQLKGRAGRKPLALLAHSLESAAPLIEEIPREAVRLAGRFWPGPLTLVFKSSALGRLVTGGLETIGVRIPDHPVALAILKRVGIPLATTSVNRSGEDPAITGDEVRPFSQYVDITLDGGRCRVKEASSVIDLSHFPFTVIRDGAIPKKELEAVLFS